MSKQPVTWYLGDLPGLHADPLPQPFLNEAERDEWRAAHVNGTGHYVLCLTETRPA